MGRSVLGPGDPCRGRGLHGLVVCLPRASACRRGHASGRAGGDQRAARPQAPRQDRSHRRAVAAPAARAPGGCPRPGCPFEHVRQWRSRARLRNTLCPERTSWTQRIRATLYHHGVAGAPDDLRTFAGRQFLAGLQLPLDAAERLRVALEIIDMLDIQLSAIERDLRALARHQTGCRALMTQYGMGELSALVTLFELGDVTRMHSSRQAVRLAGLDIGVHRSDRHAQLGKLTRQGSAPLRWALYEAAQSACRPDQPRLCTTTTRSRPAASSHTRASLTIARKLARRSFHLLRALGPAALEPPEHHSRSTAPSQPTPSHDASPSCGQLPQRSRHPPPNGAAHQRPSGRRRSTGTTDQPSSHRPPPPAVAGPDKAGHPRSPRPSPNHNTHQEVLDTHEPELR